MRPSRPTDPAAHFAHFAHFARRRAACARMPTRVA